MHDSQRYRSNASECLLASYEASQPCYGKLNFSMAALWLALAGPWPGDDARNMRGLGVLWLNCRHEGERP
jgi:hypothetical protein